MLSPPAVVCSRCPPSIELTLCLSASIDAIGVMILYIPTRVRVPNNCVPIVPLAGGFCIEFNFVHHIYKNIPVLHSSRRLRFVIPLLYLRYLCCLCFGCLWGVCVCVCAYLYY
jgi:hypothetical protein